MFYWVKHFYIVLFYQLKRYDLDLNETKVFNVLVVGQRRYAFGFFKKFHVTKYRQNTKKKQFLRNSFIS